MYEQLPQRSSTEFLPTTKNTDHLNTLTQRLPSFKLKGIPLILLTLLATFGLLDLGYQTYNFIHTHTHTRTPISCNCGSTVPEALSNNCKYDSLAAAWLPPACRNDALTSAFERVGSNPDGSWPYYADVNGTKPLSMEEVSMLPETGEGGGDAGSVFFTTRGWHLVHCMYYWKKMFWSRELGTTIERRYDNLGHIEHCQMMVMKGGGLDEIATAAGVALHSDWINGKMDTEKEHEHKHGNGNNHGSH